MANKGYKAPGKSHRRGITFFELADMFPTEKATAAWFEAIRWAGGEKDCPHCGAAGNIKSAKNGKPQPFRCGDCRKFFSVRTKTVLQGSNLPLRKWAIGIFLMSSSLKGVSSMRLHRELGITQKTAWMMAQKIREAFKDDFPLSGEVEIDEAFFGGSYGMSEREKKRRGRPVKNEIKPLDKSAEEIARRLLRTVCHPSTSYQAAKKKF